MSKKVKFSSKIEEKLLTELRAYSKESKTNISDIVNEAVAKHLDNVKIRPAFRLAAAQIIKENNELLTELAK